MANVKDDEFETLEFADESEYIGDDEGDEQPEHLRPTKTDRGFQHLPPIPATHGGRPAGQAYVYESSAANGPHLWLGVEQPADSNHPDNGAVIGARIHMRVEDAVRLAEQILYLVEHHYQNAREEGGPHRG